LIRCVNPSFVLRNCSYGARVNMDDWLRAARQVLQDLRAEYEAAGRGADFEQRVAQLQPDSRRVLIDG
jgi:hypothetical protein